MTGTIDLTDPQQAQAFLNIMRQANVGSGSGRNQSTPSSTSSFTAPRSTSTPFSSGTGDNVRSIFNDLTGVIQRSGGSVSQFAGEMTNLAGLIPGIGGALELFGGSATNFIGYLEETNRTFQALSKVGAGFNGDLGALRAAAANTRMPLEAFANMVGRNSQALAGLGVGVNGGAQRFSELSRAMFEDGQVIRGMTNLGYTLEEANEFLLDNATLLRRQAMREGMSDQQVAQATLRMAEGIAFMAEITGESAEQQRQELIDAQRDGKNIAALRLLEMQGIEGVQESFNTAFSQLAAAGPDAQAYLQDILQSNAPMSKLTQNFESMNGATAAQIRQMVALIRSNQDAESKNAAVRAAANAAVTTAASEYTSATNLAVASLGQVSDVGASQANLIAETENYRLGVEQMRRRMAQERGQQGFGNVTQEEAAQRYLMEMRDRVGGQAAGGGPGQAPSRALNEATIALADSAAGVNAEIGRNLSANTELQRAATRLLGGIGNTAIGGGIIAQEAVNGILPGDVDQAVLAANTFSTMFEPLVTTNGLKVTFDGLPELLAGMGGLTPEQVQRIMEQGRLEPRALGGPVRALQGYLVGEEGPETFVPGANGVILPNMQETMSSMQRAMETIMPAMRRETGSMQGNLMQMANNLRSKVDQSFAMTGTVDPTAIMSEVRSAMSGNPNISTQRMEQLLDNLNQSMLQLVSINSIMSRNGERTMDALRGASGNLLQGVRAR